MKLALYRAKLRAQRAAKTLLGNTVGSAAIGALHLARKFDPAKTANFFGALMRRIGPRLPEQRIGRANLTAAFPENPPSRLKRSSPASGTISAAPRRSSRIWIQCGTTIRVIPRAAASR